jgi:hypothetical protein
VLGAILPGGSKSCLRLDFRFPFCTIWFLVSSIYHIITTCNRSDGLLKSDLKWVKSKSWWCITLLRRLNWKVLTILCPQIKYLDAHLHGNSHWAISAIRGFKNKKYMLR